MTDIKILYASRYLCGYSGNNEYVHAHPYFQLFLVCPGNTVIRTEYEIIEIEKNSIVLIKPDHK